MDQRLKYRTVYIADDSWIFGRNSIFFVNNTVYSRCDRSSEKKDKRWSMTANEIMKSIKDNLNSVDQNLEQIQCDDCILRQTAIDIFKNAIGDKYPFICEPILITLSLIPSVTPKPKTGKWIPVSERLPEKNEWVLVTVEQNGNCYQEIMRRHKYIDAWTDDIDNYTDIITAWMPLPEPYEPQERSDKE